MVILEFSTVNGTNLQIVAPKRCEKQSRQAFLYWNPPPPPPSQWFLRAAIFNEKKALVASLGRRVIAGGFPVGAYKLYGRTHGHDEKTRCCREAA